MKNIKAIQLFVAALAMCSAHADDIGYRFVADHADSLYRVGEQAVITITATNGAGVAVKSGGCRLEVDNFGKKSMEVRPRVNFATDNPIVVTGRLDRPGFVRVRLLGKGIPWATQWCVGFDVDKIRPGSARPADFDAFWDRAIERFAKEVPVDAKMELDEKASGGSHDCYALTFATVPKGRVIRGQLTIPRGDGPWPVSMTVPGAGSGSWGYERLKGRARLVLNVLDYPCRPDADHPVKELYAKQNAHWGGKSGCGRNWYYEGDLSKGPEEFFYYGAILGINRAVDWVAALDRIKAGDFTYAGHSQGGAFGIILAALNGNLTQAQLSEPAITDISGFLDDGRQSGWPTLPEKMHGKPLFDSMMKWLPYFDCAHFAPRIRIPTRWLVGFTDELCTPQSIWAGYNCLTCPDRKIVCWPGLNHGFPEAVYNQAAKALEASWQQQTP